MECYRCGSTGHFAAECPLSLPADSHDEHMGRIASIVRWWIENEITMKRKRQMIADENRLYYGNDCPAKLLKTT